MSNCSNCYNGCTEVVSDQCVKYTGIDVPIMGILKGDSLSYVEQALITFLGSTLDGSGIKLNIDEGIICTLVSGYLTECSDLTALDLFKALIQAACDLQEQVDVEQARIDAIEADYTVSCLSGVVASSNTHLIVQAIITKLCEIDTDLAALAIDLDTNYVKIADIDTYIAAYLEGIAPEDRYSSRMVPYTVVEYYGSLAFFDGTGAGLADTAWEDIYLCNGLNGTPDKRGRVAVGAIDGVPGGTLSPTVNPASSAFNPNYALGDTAYGTNSVTLTEDEIPSHTHVISQTPHTHELEVVTSGSDAPNGGTNYPVFNSTNIDGGATGEPVGITMDAESADISNNATGGDDAHDNKQPALACYYLMYIPA